MGGVGIVAFGFVTTAATGFLTSALLTGVGLFLVGAAFLATATGFKGCLITGFVA
jgi:hypothetical protein